MTEPHMPGKENVVARAIYHDRLDAATFEFRIETREGGYALIHGFAGHDLNTEEFFQWEYEMKSMLPEPHAETPQSNFAVESLLAQWKEATIPRFEDLDEARRRRDVERLRPPQPSDEPR